VDIPEDLEVPREKKAIMSCSPREIPAHQEQRGNIGPGVSNFAEEGTQAGRRETWGGIA